MISGYKLYNQELRGMASNKAMYFSIFFPYKSNPSGTLGRQRVLLTTFLVVHQASGEAAAADHRTVDVDFPYLSPWFGGSKSQGNFWFFFGGGRINFLVQSVQWICTLWLFNIAMENGPFIDYLPINTSIYKGFSMANC